MIDRRHPAGTYLYVEGSPADTIGYVKHGAVALLRGRGDDLHAIRRAGSFVGIEAISQPTYLDSARAITDVTICGASRAEMLAWLERDGTARAALDMVIRTVATDTAVRSRTEGSAPQRVAIWLSDDARHAELPRAVLAGLLGMRPETLSRALTSLARAGAIRVTRARIEVADAALVSAIADGKSPERQR